MEPSPRYSLIIKIAIFGHEVWNLKKFQTLHMDPLSTLSLFLLYMRPFSRYGPFFKIFTFRHEIWNLKKGPKVAYVISLYTRGSKLSLFSLCGQLFSRYGLISKFPYLSMKSDI